MTKLVYVCRVMSANFIRDFFASLRNIIGGRLKPYENMLNKAIEETRVEFEEKYPRAKNFKMQVTEMHDASIVVVIYGEIRG